MRRSPGWYEEDCDWSIVAVIFPQHFIGSYGTALDTLKNWNPEAYQRFFGIALRPGESHKLDESLFREKHKDDYVVVSAIGRDNGLVECFAVRGGRSDNGKYASKDEKTVFVLQAEYDTRSTFGYVLQE